jgi:hypothetical protein
MDARMPMPALVFLMLMPAILFFLSEMWANSLGSLVQGQHPAKQMPTQQ